MKKISWSDLTKGKKQGYIDGCVDQYGRKNLGIEADEAMETIIDIFDKDQESQKILIEERVQELENFFDNNICEHDFKYAFSLDDELGIRIYEEDLVDSDISYKDFYALYMAKGWEI